jgi:hypothetical protein
MTLHRRDLLALVGSSAIALSAGEASATGAVIQRDVCILGGGAAGTYAALRLRDQGRSVVILERGDRLGGHAETFEDPDTGVPIDIGVQIFPDNPLPWTSGAECRWMRTARAPLSSELRSSPTCSW